MPGVYKLKNCPVCGVEHRKRGPYCSRSHALSDRQVKPETIEKIRESNKKRMEDREGDAYLEAVANLTDAQKKSKGIVRDPVPPRQQIYRDGETIDGDYWEAVDDWHL